MLKETRLSEVLSEFARTMVTDFPIQSILDHLVERIVEILPIDAAGVTLISPTTKPRFIAASDASAMGFEQLQTDLRQGPCLAAYETDLPVAIPNLSEDSRFPAFAESALKEGLVAVFTFPLRDEGRGLGALDLYRKSAGDLSQADMEAAQTLADVATAYLLNAQARVDLQTSSATESEALERLRQLDRAKTDFVTTVIHELRTPMTSIAGYTELLEDQSGGELTSAQRTFVHAIVRNSDRLTALANDLLTLSSLEPGAFSQDLTEVDLRDTFAATRSALQAILDVSAVEVSFTVPIEPVTIDGDVRQLERMLSNLVTNAVKFTEDGGWVKCELSVDGDQACITVRDNGIGIPLSEQQDLFTRFFRSSSAQEQEVQGSGLGLTIVESIVQGHGGVIDVVSEHMRGTTFRVALPLPMGDHRAGRTKLPRQRDSRLRGTDLR